MLVSGGNDVGDRRLDPSLVGDADQGDFEDLRMADERGFDFSAVHVLAAGDDDVLLAVDDEDESLLVMANKVTRVKPTPPERLGVGVGVLPVTEHQVRPAVDNLSPRRHR